MNQPKFGFTKAERVLLATRLLERKRLEFEALEREMAGFEKRVEVSDDANFFLHFGDLTGSSTLARILNEVRPDQVYNLGLS